MTLFHTCCETLQRPGGENEGEWEEDRSEGGWFATVCPPNRGERSTRMLQTKIAVEHQAIRTTRTCAMWFSKYFVANSRTVGMSIP